MTKKLFRILIILLCCLNGKSQSLFIKGNIYDYVSSKPLGDVYVGEKELTNTDSIIILSDYKSGYFEIRIENRTRFNSIVLSGLFTYKDIVIKNIPTDCDTINLNSIPFFGRFCPEAMVTWDFFCHRFDIACKIREYFYARKLRKGLEEIEKESVANANKAVYYFRNRKYKFENSENKLILDLKKPVN